MSLDDIFVTFREGQEKRGSESGKRDLDLDQVAEGVILIREDVPDGQDENSWTGGASASADQAGSIPHLMPQFRKIMEAQCTGGCEVMKWLG